MRDYFAILFLALAFSFSVIAAEGSTNDYVVLPASEGPALLKQCSRRTPDNVTNYWTPSASQIAAMEKLLPDFLRKNHFERPFSNYNRQYLGIVSQGKQLIYLNAFPRSMVREVKNWRTKAVVACDGGEAFWGIVFDPADGSFHELSSNGLA